MKSFHSRVSRVEEVAINLDEIAELNEQIERERTVEGKETPPSVTMYREFKGPKAKTNFEVNVFDDPESSGSKNGTLKKYAGASNASLKAPVDFVISS